MSRYRVSVFFVGDKGHGQCGFRTTAKDAEQAERSARQTFSATRGDGYTITTAKAVKLPEGK